MIWQHLSEAIALDIIQIIDGKRHFISINVFNIQINGFFWNDNRVFRVYRFDRFDPWIPTHPLKIGIFENFKIHWCFQNIMKISKFCLKFLKIVWNIYLNYLHSNNMNILNFLNEKFNWYRVLLLYYEKCQALLKKFLVILLLLSKFVSNE